MRPFNLESWKHEKRCARQVVAENLPAAEDKARAAAALGFSVQILNNWLRSDVGLSRTNRRALAGYYGLPLDAVDDKDTPIRDIYRRRCQEESGRRRRSGQAA